METDGCHAHLIERQHRIRIRLLRLALGIIGICRKAEANRPGIDFFRGGEVLRQPGELAQQQR